MTSYWNFTARQLRLTASLLMLCALLGCGSPGKRGDDTVNKPVPRTDLTNAAAWAIWTEVLSEHVNSYGQIDFNRLQRDRGQLDSFIGWLHGVSPATHPERFPTREAQLAYHINAYNALAMASIIDAGIPASFEPMLKRYRFFYRREVWVGDRQISLADYENKIIRPFGEERVHFVLNCMVVSCPRLPRQAFLPETLSTQLATATRKFIREPRNLYVDDEARTVYVSEIFSFYKKDFRAKAPSLIDYINLHRERVLPTDYKLRFIEYDWRLNQRY